MKVEIEEAILKVKAAAEDKQAENVDSELKEENVAEQEKKVTDSNDASNDAKEKEDVSKSEVKNEKEAQPSNTPSEVVSKYWKACLSGDVDEAVALCADNLKAEIGYNVGQLKEEMEYGSADLMDSLVNDAQEIFYYAGDYDDIIDAEYLREDKDMQAAVEDINHLIYEEYMIVSVSEDAEMIDDSTATVRADLSSRTFDANAFLEGEKIKGNLQGVVIDKLIGNSNFLTKQAAKKVMKETLIGYLKDLKKHVEDSDIVPVNSRTYYLTNETGNWLIYRIDIDNNSSNAN